MSVSQAVLPSFFITLASFPILNLIAKKWGIVDKPGGRKIHDKETPLTGGIAIGIGLISMYFFSPFVFYQYWPLLSAGSLLMLICLIDDIYDIPAWVRLFFQSIAALIAIYGQNLRIDTLGDILLLGQIDLGIFSVPITLFAILAGINALNLSDGIDGLAGGLVLIPLSFLAFLSFHAGLDKMFIFILYICSAILSFLMMNFRFPWQKQARVFLGDAGSTVLGFLLACLLIESSQGNEALIEPVSALWLFVVPLIDTASVISKRVLSKKNVFSASRDHLHHLLLSTGLGVTESVIAIYGIAFVGGLIATQLVDVHEALRFFSFNLLLVIYIATPISYAIFFAKQRTKSS